MEYRKKSPYQCTVEELDRELIARGNRTPCDRRFHFADREGTPARDTVMAQVKEFYHHFSGLLPDMGLRRISTWKLAETLIYMTEGIPLNHTRAVSGSDDRKDIFQIGDKPMDTPIKENVDSVAAICMKEDLIDHKDGTSSLKNKNYGKTFNLCRCEPFYHQPIGTGHLFSGFLVKEDVIATAGHCVNGNNVTDTRVLFGYRMKDSFTPVTRVPNIDIYRGTKIIQRCLNRTGSKSDWALVKLDRNVTGRQLVKLPPLPGIVPGSPPVYVIGHPCGLPLKYAAGAHVLKTENAFFVADLDIYSGNSGSPIFNGNTHELIGMVVRGDNRDFRWTGNCYISVKRPPPNGKRNTMEISGAQCTRVSEFIEFCRQQQTGRKRR